MKSMLLYIPEDLHKRLKDYAGEKNMSMTAVVIKALSEFLRRVEFEKEDMKKEAVGV